MNPTHESDHTPAQPRAFGENFLADLFTDDTRYRAWIASATGTADQPVTTSAQPDLKALTQQEFCHWARGGEAEATRRFDGKAESDTDRRFFDLRESDDAADFYGQNELDHDRVPTADGFIAWCARQAADPDGYVVTDAGLQALADTAEAPGTAGSVLRSAALYLERHGWIQGAYYDSTPGRFTPPACLVGAIGMVCYGGPVDAPAQHFDDPGFLDFEEAVLHLDRFLLVEDGSESYEFNDARGRTLDQVTDVLRKAAARPAHELIDAIRVIDARNAEMAALADLLKPSGIWGDPQAPVSTDGGDRA